MYNDLDHISFAEWLIQLNDCAVNIGYQLKPSLVGITGQLCWHSYYEERLTPHEALADAVKIGQEFGGDYCDV